MLDSTPVPAPAAGDGTPPVGDPTAPAADQSSAPAAGEDQPQDAATLTRQLNEARKQAAGYRERLRTYEEAQAAADEAKKSDAEKAAERIAELERDLAAERTSRQSDRLRLAAGTAARKAGFRNPDIAYQLIDAAAVEFDESGEPKNVEALVATIAKENAYLVGGTPDFGGGPRGGAASGESMNDRIRRAAGRGV